jgi:RNA polymerase-binding transcription factor DksA
VETDYFRDLLYRTRDALTATLEPIRARLRDGGRDSGAEVAVAVHHPADAAADSEMRELDATSAAMFEQRLRDVDEALRRLDDGTYGTCSACGRAIPPERLELVPETPYCVEDAAKANA